MITAAIFIAGCSVNHYEKGNDYLKNKQYADALAEFQKVDPDEGHFRMAQSKINYIQGMLAFNDSLFEVAEMHLQKVEKDDEYYHDSRLMLEKINQNRLAATIPSQKDTVIVKQEITTIPGKTTEGKEKEVVPSDAEINRKYVSSVEKLINRFESQYQSARTADVSTKKDYVSRMNGTLAELERLAYNPSVRDGNIVDLRGKASAWMNKRIQFINKLISDGTVSETNTSRSLKEEGDKMYFGVTAALKKVR
jgi:hypothetical protein